MTSRNTPIHVGRQTGVLLRLLAVIALVCSGMVAWAQPLIPHHDSIEWMVHDSSQIGIGTIEFSSHSTDLYAPLRLNVERVLKGAPQKSTNFIAKFRYTPDHDLVKLLAEHTWVIVCLKPSASIRDGETPFAKFPLAPRTGFEHTSISPIDGAKDHALFGMDGQAIVDPNAIVSKFDNVVRTEKTNLNLKSKSASLGGMVLMVPIDERLEAQARAWINSSDIFRRTAGVECLQFFKSSANITLAKKLLDDRQTRSTTFGEPDDAVNIRAVREAAKDLLDEWGIGWEPKPMTVNLEMVLVLPGEFVSGVVGTDVPQVVKKISIAGFWIAKNDVTVGQFRAYCKATRYHFNWDKFRPRFGWKDDHPMVYVTWSEARNYCRWIGGDLPTAAEWEKATRGTDGRRFPWGDKFDAKKLHGWPATLWSYRETAPVGSYPAGASPYGCLDMVGNVMQWCLDGPKSDPKQRFVRGPGWDSSQEWEVLRAYGFQSYLDSRAQALGFRVAATKRLKDRK